MAVKIVYATNLQSLSIRDREFKYLRNLSARYYL